MNPLAKVVLSAAVVIAIAVVALNKYNTTQENYEYRLAKAELQAEFLERAPPVRAIRDPDRYVKEARELFKWYFTELTKLYNRYPAFKSGEDAYLHELDQRKAAGQVKAEDYEAYKASYEQVKEIWDLLREGHYEPALTAGDASLRLDFLEFEPATVQGRKGIKGRFVLWGAQRRRTENRSSNGTVTAHVDVQASFPPVQLKMTDAKGKPTAEASFSMPAGAYVPLPEQKIADFPPMAYIGSFAFPLVPFKAENVDIEAAAVTRASSGEDVRGTFKWTMKVPAEWKLAEGEAWEGATVEEREELAR